MTDRSCGTCSACCTAIGVRELKKPPGKDCLFQQAGEKGCSIHFSKPEACHTFQCMWLQGDFPLVLKPEYTGIVPYVPENRDGLDLSKVVVLVESRPGAFEEHHYVREIIERAGGIVAAIPFGTERVDLELPDPPRLRVIQ